jgi:outer membrane lipoprotein SlyB
MVMMNVSGDDIAPARSMPMADPDTREEMPDRSREEGARAAKTDEEGHPVAAGVGALAGAAAAGAVAGAVAGPGGAAVGAVIGGVAGAIGGREFAEKAEETVEEQRQEMDAEAERLENTPVVPVPPVPAAPVSGGTRSITASETGTPNTSWENEDGGEAPTTAERSSGRRTKRGAGRQRANRPSPDDTRRGE